MKILVTGANGFVGGHLCRALEAAGVEVVRAVRNPQSGAVAVGSIDSSTEWSAVLRAWMQWFIWPDEHIFYMKQLLIR